MLSKVFEKWFESEGGVAQMERFRSFLSEWGSVLLWSFVVFAVLFLLFSLGGEEINKPAVKTIIAITVFISAIIILLNPFDTSRVYITFLMIILSISLYVAIVKLGKTVVEKYEEMEKAKIESMIKDKKPIVCKGYLVKKPEFVKMGKEVFVKMEDGKVISLSVCRQVQ